MIRSINMRSVILATALVALGAVLALVLQPRFAHKEAAQGANGQPVVHPTFKLQPPRPAFTGDEEAYAAALWPIHSQVKDYAVRMTFAGLAYKMKEADAAATKQKLLAVQSGFASVAEQVSKLSAPDSFAEQQRNYAQAVEHYSASVAQMIQATEDGRDQHLVEAQMRSHAAGELLLKIGNTLWPTEYKPN